MSDVIRFACMIAAATTLAAQQPEAAFPPDQMAKGIELGKQFKSRKQFIENGLKDNKIQMSSAWAKDAISKYVTFYRDYHVVAADIAEANQQLRDVSEKDLSTIPYTGLLFAYLELHARGMLPIRHLNKRFIDGSTHMVLQIDGTNIQPAKEGFGPKREKKTCVGQYYTYSVFAVHNFAIGTGGVNEFTWDCTEQFTKYSVEFGFLLTPEQQQKRGQIIIIDSEGHRHSAAVDLSALR
jgi:hypothetical protein